MAHIGKVFRRLCSRPIGGTFGFCYGQLRSPGNLGYSMACEYYDVLDPFPHGGPPQRQELRRHLLPQQIHPNTHFDQPVSVVPNQQPLLRACWGRSAFRHSQGNPALSLSTPSHHSAPYLPATAASAISTRPMTSDSTPRRQWLAQSPIPPSTPLSSSSPTNV